MSGMLSGGFGTSCMLDFGFSGSFVQLGPWAGLGITLTIAADGTITGNPLFSVHAGNSFGIALVGVPFEEQHIVSAALYVNGAVTPSIPVVVPVPDGSTPTGYGAVLVLPGSLTKSLGPGIATYRIDLTASTGDVATVVESRFRVLPGAPLPATPQALTRGLAETLTLTILDTNGQPYNLTGAALVLAAGALRKTQSAGAIMVTTPASGVAVVTLTAADTASLPAGTLTWTLADANNPGIAFPGGSIPVI